MTDADIDRIADTYHAWRGEEDAIARVGEYEDVLGFCKSAPLEEIRKHGHVLTPGRYVGAGAAEEDAAFTPRPFLARNVESGLLFTPYLLIFMTRYMPVAALSAAVPKGLTRTVYSVPAAALLGTRRL